MWSVNKKGVCFLSVLYLIVFCSVQVLLHCTVSIYKLSVFLLYCTYTHLDKYAHKKRSIIGAIKKKKKNGALFILVTLFNSDLVTYVIFT